MNSVAGPFTISSFTQNATTVQALDMALDVLKKFHAQGLTQEQLNSARNYLKGQFPPQIETGRQLSQLVAELDFYGLDEGEINSFFSKLDRLTVEDANRVIRTYYPLDDVVFVLIGKATEIREKVKKYAPRIDEVPITRPGFSTAPGAQPRRPSRSGHAHQPSRMGLE
jgi:predicted Zn-dependent peptidase